MQTWHANFTEIKLGLDQNLSYIAHEKKRGGGGGVERQFRKAMWGT